MIIIVHESGVVDIMANKSLDGVVNIVVDKRCIVKIMVQILSYSIKYILIYENSVMNETCHVLIESVVDVDPLCLG